MFYAALNVYRNEKTDESRLRMIKTLSDYKNCIRQTKFDYDKTETEVVLENA